MSKMALAGVERATRPLDAPESMRRSTPGLRATTFSAMGLRTRMLHGGPDPNSREAVVFVHGNPGSCEDWRALMAPVSNFARVIALDMPGFGQADKPDVDYTVELGAAFLGEALKQLGVDRVHLVLHDLGGPWGFTWAASQPRQVASVAMIDTGAVARGFKWHWAARLWRLPLLGELQMMLNNRPAFRWVIEEGRRGKLPIDFVDRLYKDLDGGTKRAILRIVRNTPTLGGARTEAMIAALRPLDLPALVIWGAKDSFLPVAWAQEQREVFPKAEIVVLPEAGHFPLAEDPEAVIKAVQPFLRLQWGVPG